MDPNTLAVAPLSDIEESDQDEDLTFPLYYYVKNKIGPYGAPKDLETLIEQRTEYEMQLDRAFLYRQNRSWPLYPFSKWSRFKLEKWYWEKLPVQERPARASYLYNNPLLDDGDQALILSLINSRYPCVMQIMDLYPGHIFPCGGFFTSPYASHDIDLFFVNCSEEKAREIMIAFERFFLEAHYCEETILRLIRTAGTTTFEIGFESKSSRSYQFVHRIYPSLAHVLGGFDISPSMIGFDGTNVVANEMGAWAWVNQTMVVDISRRSLSFQYRLLKYFRRGFNVIFPGIYHERFDEEASDPQRKIQEFYEALNELKKKYNVIMKRGVSSHSNNVYPDHYYYNDYGYGVALNGNDSGIYGVREGGDYLDFRLIEKATFNGLRIFSLGQTQNGRGPKKNVPVSDYDVAVLATKNFACANFLAVYEKKPEKVSVVSFYYDETRLLASNKFGLEFSDVPRNRALENYFLFKAALDYDDCRRIDFKELKLGVFAAEEKIRFGVFLTQDPGRQWSSTVNPAIIEANDFYCGKWNGLKAIPIYNFPLYLLLRLASRKSPGSYVYGFPDDVIRLIVNTLALV